MSSTASGGTCLSPLPLSVRAEEDRATFVHPMNTVLHSKTCKFVIAWVPKCACSSLRDFFIQFHRLYNPHFDLSHVDLNYHHLHKRLAFQPDPALIISEVERVIMVIRRPLYRFLSYFFDKHVLQRDWKLMTNSTYQRFRVWMDDKNYPYTIRSLLTFMLSFGHLDIHDLPQVRFIPDWWEKVPVSKRSVIDMDTVPSLGMALRQELQCTLSVFRKRQHPFLKFARLFQQFPRHNTSTIKTPAKPKAPTSLQLPAVPTPPIRPHVPSVGWLDKTVVQWREEYRANGRSFPSYDSPQASDVERCAAFQTLYAPDIHFHARARKKNI